MKWATAPPDLPTTMPTCGSRYTTCRRSCVHRGCAASRPCPIHLRMKVSLTSLPLLRMPIPCNTACSCSLTHVPKNCFKPQPIALGGRCIQRRSKSPRMAIGCKGRAWPMPVMCTANGQALVPHGQHGWLMSKYTETPVKYTSSAWSLVMTQAWWSTLKALSNKCMAMCCKPPAGPCSKKWRPMPKTVAWSAKTGAATRF